jgi:hypothetical protein
VERVPRQAYAATLCLSGTVVQAFFLEEDVDNPTAITPGDPWLDFTRRVWPATDAFRWPPRLSLNDGDFSLERFARRWAAKAEERIPPAPLAL